MYLFPAQSYPSVSSPFARAEKRDKENQTGFDMVEEERELFCRAHKRESLDPPRERGVGAANRVF